MPGFSQNINRHKQADQRQPYNTGDSGHNPKQSRRKDQKFSAESGGTDFGQNQNNIPQNEEVKNSRNSQNFKYIN